MKPVLVALFMIFLFYSSYSHNFSLGIKGGLNLSTFKGDGLNEVQAQAGFHVGAFASFRLRKAILQLETFFSSQRVHHRGYQSVIEPDTKLKMDYLQTVVLTKIYATKSFSLHTGTQIGLLLIAKEDDGFAKGVNTHKGFITYKPVAEGLEMMNKFKELKELL